MNKAITIICLTLIALAAIVLAPRFLESTCEKVLRQSSTEIQTNIELVKGLAVKLNFGYKLEPLFMESEKVLAEAQGCCFLKDQDPSHSCEKEKKIS